MAIVGPYIVGELAEVVVIEFEVMGLIGLSPAEGSWSSILCLISVAKVELTIRLRW